MGTPTASDHCPPGIGRGLTLGTDGIWHAPSSTTVSYPDDGHHSLFAVEDGSFWFAHRNRCVVEAVSCFPPAAEQPIVDIGGGNGYVGAELIQAGFDVVLLEPGIHGARNAKARGIPTVICASTKTAGIADGSLAAIGVFDVVEHMQDDQQFLCELHGLLQPHGLLYATVPALSALWSQEDVDAGHFRRYSLSAFTSALTAAGFEVLFGTYIFRPLPIPIALLRALPYRLGLRRTAPVANSHHTRPGLGRRFIDGLLRSEVDNIAQLRPMRWGGSCLVVARRR